MSFRARDATRRPARRQNGEPFPVGANNIGRRDSIFRLRDGGNAGWPGCGRGLLPAGEGAGSRPW